MAATQKEKSGKGGQTSDVEPGDFEPGTRYPIEYLVQLSEDGNKEPLNRLLKAFAAIQELPPSNEFSFQQIASYHGQPFHVRNDVDYTYWGGYCMHGNVLFPVWHRAYVNYLEKALQSIDPEVMMPFWDELSDETLEHGLPSIFTEDNVTIDGEEKPNPLKSFSFPYSYLDDINTEMGENNDTGGNQQTYVTVRFPLFHENIGTNEQQMAAEELNKRYYTAGQPDEDNLTKILNNNIVGWFVGTSSVVPAYDTTSERYKLCMEAENYTIFSNNTSMSKWKKDNPEEAFSLEQPHNDGHLAIGAMDPPPTYSLLAYGDMGYNETASYDPVFFFHHCFIDRMFWLWQVKHESTQSLDVIPGYPGTSSSDAQGPTPGTQPGQELDMETPLYPFTNPDTCEPYTGSQLANLEAMGISYKGGKPVDPPTPAPARFSLDAYDGSRRKIEVTGVDRTIFNGPFTVLVFLVVNGEAHPVGYETVFNRLKSSECIGCMAHRYMSFVFNLYKADPQIAYDKDAQIKVVFHGRVLPGEKVEYESSFIP